MWRLPSVRAGLVRVKRKLFTVGHGYAMLVWDGTFAVESYLVLVATQKARLIAFLYAYRPGSYHPHIGWQGSCRLPCLIASNETTRFVET